MNLNPLYFLRKYRRFVDIEKLKKFIQIGNSHLYENFGMSLNAPSPEKKYLIVGDNTILDCFISIDSKWAEVEIGSNSWIGGSKIACLSKIEIGDNVFISWGGYISDHNSHSVDYRERQNDINQQLTDYRSGKDILQNKNWTTVATTPVKICSNVWIGMNTIILKGVTIGEGSIVAAGSVVVKSIPPWTIAGGNPATVIKEIPYEMRKDCNR